ncbi:hypothetical protein Ahy_B05g073910 isoform A [Arachis hypogaea]|uniref:Transposase MuDR plant domain-containing protein n=1 Tax=Arachis hypogaea TaxID=3818 RepID=A0A444YXD3_ARAHY|nr:hypothetical protein Ahy_B05g073910 isoform A [Arachis hypogaea]
MNVTDAIMLEMLMIYQQNQAHVSMIELYVEFEELAISHGVDESFLPEGGNTDWEENDIDSKEEFLSNNDMLGGNEITDTEIQAATSMVRSQHSFGVPSFMRALDLEDMNAPEFLELANSDGEFAVGMEFSSGETVVMPIRNYITSMGVDYRRKCCWEIRRYNGSHTCTIDIISQDHSKLDSDTIVDAIRLLVETDPYLKIRVVTTDVQLKFNYTISYRKT